MDTRPDLYLILRFLCVPLDEAHVPLVVHVPHFENHWSSLSSFSLPYLSPVFPVSGVRSKLSFRVFRVLFSPFCFFSGAMEAVRGSPSPLFTRNLPPFAGHASQPLSTANARPPFTAQTSLPPLAAHASPPTDAHVPLGLLVAYEGMGWSPAPEPAPRQRPSVPAPRKRFAVPAPPELPQESVPPELLQVSTRPERPQESVLPECPQESMLPERPQEPAHPERPLLGSAHWSPRFQSAPRTPTM